MCDVYHDRTYVFDLTVEPPKQIATITMHGGGYWMCFSPDGKLCYISERIGDSVAVIVPRLVMGLRQGWSGSTVALPPGRWSDVLGGSTADEGPVSLDALLTGFPVALLVRTSR